MNNNRMPQQVLILPFRLNSSKIVEYCILHRKKPKVWQWVSGGVEKGETLIECATREIQEELNIFEPLNLQKLNSICSIPAYHFKEYLTNWGKEILLVQESTFALEVTAEQTMNISAEHFEYRWVKYDDAMELLQWDSNKTALWELNELLKQDVIKIKS